MLASLAVAASSMLFADAKDVVLDRPIPELLVEAEFERALGHSISATWNNMRLRGIARRITENRRIAVLLDRRLDPSRELELEINNKTVRQVLEQVADEVSARISVSPSTVYVGPERPAEVLRTLIALRTAELFDSTVGADPGRRFELGTRQTLHWNDLDSPAQLIRTIAEAYSLEVAGVEQIPHDLWAGATLPAVSAAEALSLILIQFDLTFAWTSGGAGIRIVPVPEEVSLERDYVIRRLSPGEVTRRLEDEFPGLQTQVQRRQLIVRGTLEQHEAVERLLNPRPRTATNQRSAESQPLSQQKFTLRTKAVPAIALLRALEDKDIDLEYDAAKLAAAGIDLEQGIDLDVSNASAEEFFKTICEPLGLKFTIDGSTVTLEPE